MLALRLLLKAALLACCVAAFGAQGADTHVPVQVLVKTDQGDFTLELYPDRAPKTVANFLDYSRRYFYDGLIFHRVVKDFVIQSGGYTFDLSAKETDEPVVNESANGLKNTRGSLAMARHTDPDSATSQFYVNLKNNSSLDAKGGKPGYTVFGKVISGMETVDAIAAVRVRREGAFTHLPAQPIQILSIREISAP